MKLTYDKFIDLLLRNYLFIHLEKRGRRYSRRPLDARFYLQAQ